MKLDAPSVEVEHVNRPPDADQDWDSAVDYAASSFENWNTNLQNRENKNDEQERESLEDAGDLSSLIWWVWRREV